MGTEYGGTIDASDENLDIGFSTDKGVDCGGVERLKELKIIEGCASMKFSLELLLEVTVISGIVGGDGDFEFLGEATKVFDEMNGEGALGNVSTRLCGKFDTLASEVTKDDWIVLEDEREGRLSEFRAVRTENGGFELIIVGGEGEGFDDCRMRAVHMEHIQGEILSVAEEMKSEGTRVVFRESSKIRVTMGIELSDISN